MQLLNVHTLRLTTFYDQDVPRYAILSHTWEDEEILYGDICDPEKPFPQHKKGFFKVKHSCEQAACDEFDWIWIDTCCIDKSSSAELSEAINSMFRWYNDSAVCYAYISDVVKTDAQSVRFVDSRWFTRGWTLQELIAPKRVVFFDARWERIGWRQHESLANEIAEATGIPSDLLERRNTQLPGTDLRAKLDRYSVAQRFSWASKRSTKRVEDEAYCLLGIFGVNMPLLYGEGPKAFFRFQQEILRTTDDQSILAFQHTSNSNNLLAESPRDYTVSGGIGRPSFLNENDPGSSANSILTPSAKVLKMRLYLCPPLRPDLKSQYLGVLSCVLHLHGDTNQTVFPVMDLEPVRHSTKPNEFYRTANHHLSIVTP
ncbi:heterokaryon incompatibility protein-domain-containing protein, partial [Neurospora tetraspora]